MPTLVAPSLSKDEFDRLRKVGFGEINAETSVPSRSFHDVVEGPLKPLSWSGDIPEPSEKERRLAGLANTLSWIANVVLILVKVIALVVSNSKSVAAAAVDSAADLISQMMLSAAVWHMNKHNPGIHKVL